MKISTQENYQEASLSWKFDTQLGQIPYKRYQKNTSGVKIRLMEFGPQNILTVTRHDLSQFGMI